MSGTKSVLKGSATVPYDQLKSILTKKIVWNQVYSEISGMEGELHGKVNKFTAEQTEYMEVVNVLLDAILSGEAKVCFPLFTEIQDKYKVVEEKVSDFKTKLTQATQDVKNGRMRWLDQFLTNQSDFITIFSAKERKAMVKQCKDGDSFAVRTKLMVRELTRKWNILEPDMENRLKECIRGVEDLLGNNLDFSRILKNSSSLSGSWRERVTRILRNRALKTMRTNRKGRKIPGSENSSQK